MPQDTILECACGARYVVHAAAGEELRCGRCGELVRPATEAAAPAGEDEFRARDPDELMADVNRSILSKSLLLSLVVHVALLGLTSFGLYRAWAEYGFMLPHEIKEKKQAAAREAEEARRRAAREAAAEEAAGETAEAPAEPDAAPPAAPAGGEAEEDVPAVVREATETSEERPAESAVSLDEDVGLED
jgi:cytoskeletal protein RodZ